nr:unnamed protein product [Callosobruchus analis]CAI5841231.1 unnamed protein product [Callosobruchus analis]
MRLDFTALYLSSCLRRQACLVRNILEQTETLRRKNTSTNDEVKYQSSVRQCLILAIKIHQSLIRTNTGVREKIGTDFYVLFLITIPLCAATLCMALQVSSRFSRLANLVIANKSIF